MSINRFQTALPETLSVPDAVQAMIEGDERLRLPLCYQVVALPLFDRIAECKDSVGRAYDSALEFGSTTGQAAARKAFDNMANVERLVQLYRLDLESKADSDNTDTIDRAWLVPWAHDTHGVDIFGIHARRKRGVTDKDQAEIFSIPKPSSPTLEDSKQWAETHLLSGERLRQHVLGEPPAPKPVFSEGQKLYLSMAWLFDQLLTKRNGQWREIVHDPNDNTSLGFFANGNLKVSRLARSVVDQLPVDVGGEKETTKATKGHIKFVIDYLTPGLDQVPEFSKQKSRHGFRTLYGLARAVWKSKTGQVVPDPQTIQYPVDCLTLLASDVTDETPLTPDELKDCLDKALTATTKLYPTVSR